MFNYLGTFGGKGKADPHILAWIKITDSSQQNNSAPIIEQSSKAVHCTRRSQIAMRWTNQHMSTVIERDGLLICSQGVISIWPQRKAVRTASPTQDSVFAVNNSLLVLPIWGHKDTFIMAEKSLSGNRQPSGPLGTSQGGVGWKTEGS